METKKSVPVKLDLATLLATQPKQVQLNDEQEVVIPDECGDTQWDKVLAQYETEDPDKK
ncbi:hypothetical protein QM480_14785 [Flectobacillus sp. DC10W]|uniref:Uncharacterized protein n=1 Tax=Flectobacillus longus TaxID=2984207 RepID=A0ABT6YPV1_9BACT|nr:hypothetical protein [Flectobacillus longus]MDI9865607.1 hypothetical protein [Flectobacillus longus]